MPHELFMTIEDFSISWSTGAK